MFLIAWAEILVCPMAKQFASGSERLIVPLWLLRREIPERMVRLPQVVRDQRLLGHPRLLAQWTLSFSPRLQGLYGLDRFLRLQRLRPFSAYSVLMALLNQLEF